MGLIKDLAEYFALRAGEIISQKLGPDGAYQLGRNVGRLGHAILASRRRTARQNLALASIGSRDDVQRIERRSFEHLCGVMLESLAVLRHPEPYLEGDMVFEGLERVDECLARGRGAIAVIAHLGNWELAGLAAARRGYPITSIVRPFRNARLDRFLVGARAKTGQRVLANRGSLCRMLGALRENRILIIPCDQWARTGVRVNFLGRPTLTTRTPATLSLRTGAPILPVNVFRNGRVGATHHVEVSPPIEPSEFRDIGAMTQEICRALEGFIRRHPDQWMWMHDRWKPMARVPAAAPIPVLV